MVKTPSNILQKVFFSQEPASAPRVLRFPEPTAEVAGSSDGSVLKHAPQARFSGLSPAETDASASGSQGCLQSQEDENLMESPRGQLQR